MWRERHFAFGLAALVAVAAAGLRGARAGETQPATHALSTEAPLTATVSRPGEGVVALRSAGPSSVLIPAGTFIMGSDAKELELVIASCKRHPLGGDDCEKYFVNELEAHDVTLSAYRIDRTEVTVAAYRRCVDAGRCGPPAYGGGGERFDRDDFPVSLVSWNDADTYCRVAGGRLPTEAEWERAARGTSGRRFPWGNLFHGGRCNHGVLALAEGIVVDETDDGDGFDELAPVSSFPAGRTPDGIDDMAGNVAEWVADAADDVFGSRYAPASEVNPTGPTGGAFHVVRGGGFQAAAPWLRTAARTFRPASWRKPYVGFRCAYPSG